MYFQDSNKTIQLEAFHVFKVVYKILDLVFILRVYTNTSCFFSWFRFFWLDIFQFLSATSSLLLIKTSLLRLWTFLSQTEASSYDSLVTSGLIKVWKLLILKHYIINSFALQSFDTYFSPTCFREWGLWSRQSSSCERNCYPWTRKSICSSRKMWGSLLIK